MMDSKKPTDAENEFFAREDAEKLARLAHSHERARVGQVVTGGLLIEAGMLVLGSCGEQIAVVDHMEGESIVKLKKDATGLHHYLPVSWVISTAQNTVKINRPAQEAKEEWLSA